MSLAPNVERDRKWEHWQRADPSVRNARWVARGMVVAMVVTSLWAIGVATMGW